MPVVDVGTVFVGVSDLERSISFYTKALGFVNREIEDWGDGRRGATLFFPIPGATLFTLAEKEHVQVFSEPVFNLTCKNAVSLYHELKEAGYQVTELEQWETEWNNHVLFDLIDPDGHMIAMIEMNPK